MVAKAYRMKSNRVGMARAAIAPESLTEETGCEYIQKIC
jgi:hypothetical protein